MQKQLTINNNDDLVVLLEKRELPQGIISEQVSIDGEYVCLGHFDYAKITRIPPEKKEAQFLTFRNHNDMATLYETVEDPEGLQQNYLVASKGNEPKAIDPALYNFVFMMTVSVSNNDKTLEEYAKEYRCELQKRIDGKDVGIEIYFPISKGDVIVMLYSNDFVGSTRILSEFACLTSVRYSFTIPLVRSKWLKDDYTEGEPPSVDKACSMRLRATVSDYAGLDLFIRQMVEAGSCFNVDDIRKSASYGTDDIEYNLGDFTEAKLYSYLKHVISYQSDFRQCIFTAEMDISRSLVW